MPALTPSYLMDFESRMQRLTEQEYVRLNRNLWWQRITKVRQSSSRRDVLTWLLSTATIRDQGKGGNIAFEDLVSTFTEIESGYSGDGLKLRRAQLEDTDGDGLNLGSEWSAQIGAYMAYWPQKRVVDVLKNGGDPLKYTGYDKLAYFAAGHPVNPYNTGLGAYNNVFTGAPVGSYPGAVPIHDGVTLDVALANLSKIMGYIATIKMPNGEDPRFLRPAAILCPPALFPRAVQLTGAKFFGLPVTGGGVASADVEGIIKALGYATPIMVDELAGFENDTTYYVACENVTESQLGAVIYTERESFKINYYSTLDQAQLDRAQELEWHCIGRNAVSPGHPYLLFKCKAT
jgi:hypothetical protein